MNPDPNQPITPPIPPVESDVTPPAPPPAPPTPVEIPQTTSTPPPPPATGITTDTKVKWGAGKVVGAIVVVVVLVAGLAAGIFLSQRQQNVVKTPAAVCAPNDVLEKYCDSSNQTACHKCVNNQWEEHSAGDCSSLTCEPCGPSGNNTTCSSGGNTGGGGGTCDSLSCTATSSQFVRHFVCSTRLIGGKCDLTAPGAVVISDTGDNRSLKTATYFGQACTSEQIDIFNDIADPYTNSNGYVTSIQRDNDFSNCGGTVPTATPTPGNHDPSGFAGVSCEPNAQMTIRGSATDPDAANTSLQLHLYFDSDPSDNNAAVLTDTVTATNGRFSRVLPNTVARYAGTGPAVVLNDNQNHVVKAYAINAPGTAGANHELTNSPITFTFAGCAGPTATPTTPPTPTPTIPGSASCQQVTIVKIMHSGSEVANPSLAKIQKGDVVTFRGFATATNTVVTNINFILTKSGTAQTPVSVVPTLVSGTYQADFSFTADIATTYSVSASPVYQQ